MKKITPEADALIHSWAPAGGIDYVKCLEFDVYFNVNNLDVAL